MSTVSKQQFVLRPPQFSVVVLFQLAATVGVWAAILTDGYFGRVALYLIVLATILGGLSHLAYRYLLPHRLTPFVASHALCLVWFVLYGGLLWSKEPASAKLGAVLSIASGPFAYGMSSWSALLSPVFVTAFIASALGLCFRPNLTPRICRP